MDGRTTPLGAHRPSAVRTWVVTVEVTALALSAHHVGGGGLPPTGLVLALGALVGAASYLLRRRILTLPVTATVAVAGQLGLHAAFAGSGHGGHGAHGLSSQLTPAMLGAHAAAAAVTVLALRWQERLVVRLVTLVLPTQVVPATPKATVAPAPYDAVGGLPRRLQVVRGTPRRGPPVPAAAH